MKMGLWILIHVILYEPIALGKLAYIPLMNVERRVVSFIIHPIKIVFVHNARHHSMMLAQIKQQGIGGSSKDVDDYVGIH